MKLSANIWREVTLGEFVALQRGHDLTETERRGGHVPVMGSAGQNGFHDTALAKGPGIVVGRSGASFGQVHFSAVDYWPHNTALYVTDFKGNDERFAFYFLKAIDFSGYNSGSAQPSLNRNFIYSIPVRIPPLAEQKAIAAVLGALDDKIELNRRMNATLEAMARALFQSWFVDFDLVRAKLDGRQPPNLDPATAALFPDSFQDSELGHIPKGWEVRTLGEVIELAYGKPLKAEDRKTGPICVYGANGPVGWHDEKLVSGPGIVVGRKGNPGVVTWAHGDFYPIDTTFYVEPKGDCRSLYFLFYALSNHDLANLSADSAVPGLNRNHAYMSKQVIPPASLLEAFDKQAAPIFDAIHANETQSRTLATLRDTLLPKLLSGDINISNLKSP
jgi:type I restriction enzyme S subunit